MDDNAQPENNHRKATVVKSGLGVLGALLTIISVWWFALRPRRRHDGED